MKRECGQTWKARVAIASVLAFLTSVAGQIPCAAADGAEAGAAVLGNDSYVRTFLVYQTPVSIAPGGEVKIAPDPVAKQPKPMAEFRSPLPPDGWIRPEFDDFAWDRQRIPVEVTPAGATGRSPAAKHSATSNSIICVRARFVVDDPARVQDLKLGLEYVGGAVVHVNGEELVRGHLPAGALAPDTLAEKYPDDLYCEGGGAFLQAIAKNPSGFARRYRKVEGIAVPARHLRKGINVLAVEIHRAPINDAVLAAKFEAVDGMYTVPGIWAYAALKSLSLTAGAGSAIVPNIARPKGVQVWTVRSFETITAFDYAEPGEASPLSIAAVRNGVFSGRVVVSSGEPIKGLKVAVAGLKAAGGAELPASAIRLRYAEPAVPAKSWAPSHRFDGLLDSIPAEVPVVKAGAPQETHLQQPTARPNVSAGAVASIWLSLRVPKDAKPGKYEGTVSVSAEGLPATTVPLRLTIHDWALSDPKDFRVKNMLFVSQESLARHYDVPLWSDKHFDLMGKSLALLAEVKSRQVPVNLCIDFYGLTGNRESMVRWIKQPDGSYKHDFSIFDKYLDLVAKTIGKPQPLRLNCWGEWGKDGKTNQWKWNGPSKVTVVDPATGKQEELPQPPPDTPEFLALWKPVLDEARKRIEARGWWDVTAIGHSSYCYAPQALVVDAYRKLWPDGAWAYSSHGGVLGGKFTGTDKSVAMPVRYSDCVWTEGPLKQRGYNALLKPRPGIWCGLARSRHRDGSPLTVVRDLPEEMIMRGQDGLADSGADLFPVKRPAGGYACLGNGRGTGGPSDSEKAMLAPGPDGPITTERFEVFREGVQLSEAILFLQQCIEEKKVSPELAERINRYLDDRAVANGVDPRKPWSIRYSAGRLERDGQLLALTAEAAGAAPK